MDSSFLKEREIDHSFFDAKKEGANIILIVVNRPVFLEQFQALMKLNPILICSDGGANRVYAANETANYIRTEKEWIPEHIIGDMDSVKKEVVEHFRAKGSKIHK
jgi:thiamine pyrophosphokinase